MAFGAGELVASQVVGRVAADIEPLKKGYAKAKDETEKQKSWFKTAMGDMFHVAGGMLAASGLQFGIQQIIGVTEGWIHSAIDAKAAQLELQGILTSTHNAIGMSADQINNMVQGLKNLTGVDDDVILGGVNMLLTFDKIGKQTLPSATTAIEAIAIAMNNGSLEGLNLKDAAIQLGKALQDPEHSFDALSRIGIKFSDQEKLQIKTMQDAGDTAGAQAVMLKEVHRQMDGFLNAAKADPLNKFNLAMGDIGKTIGAKLLPLLTDLSNNVLMPMATFIANNLDPTLAHVGDAFAFLGTSVGNVRDWFVKWEPEILTAGTIITTFFLPAIIKSGLEASIAAGRIALDFVGSIIKAGVQAFVAAGKLWLDPGSFFAGLGATGAAAETAAAEVDTMAVSEEAVGLKAAASAPELDAMAVSEEAVGTAATEAAGAKGAAAGIGVLGLVGAIAALGIILISNGASITKWINSWSPFTHNNGGPLSSALTNVTQEMENLDGTTQNLITSSSSLEAQFMAVNTVFGHLGGLDNLRNQLLNIVDAEASAADWAHRLNVQWAQLHVPNLGNWGPEPPTPTGGGGGKGGGHPHARGGIVGPNEMLSRLNDQGVPGELVQLPSGSIVFPHNQSVTMLQNATPSGPQAVYNQYNTINTAGDGDAIVQKLDYYKRVQAALYSGVR
jgi:hypothetical protein